MQNLKMNVHDHMNADDLKNLAKGLFALAEAYERHEYQLLKSDALETDDSESHAAIWKEIKRARREVKKARTAGSQWANRLMTSIAELHHADSDYI